MSLGRVLLDTAIFIYAIGGEHPLRQPCRLIINALKTEAFGGEASVLVVEETLHQRARRTGDRESAQLAASNIIVFCPLHDLTQAELTLGLQLFAESPRLNARDALHAATALNHGIGRIISPDDAFDDVRGLRRLDPREAAARI